jgi:hypothetical protein
MTPARTTLVLSTLLLLVSIACFGGDEPLPATVATPTPPVATQRPPVVTREPTSAPPATATATPRPQLSTPAATATRAADPTRPGETPSPVPTPIPDLSFRFGDNVSVFERTLIITAIEVTRDLLAADARVSPPVTVFAHQELEGLLRDYTEHARAQEWRAQGLVERLTNVVAEASYRGVLINTGHRAWSVLTDADLMRAVAHEYVHVVQLENAGPQIADQTLRSTVDAVPAAGPLWLLEGSAEVVSYLVADRLDIQDYAGTLVDLGIEARDNPVPLAKLETYLGYYAGGDDGIARAVLASDYLIRNRDLSQLFAYWDDIRRGSRWQDAFVRRFGTTVENFYMNFDAFYQATYGG